MIFLGLCVIVAGKWHRGERQRLWRLMVADRRYRNHCCRSFLFLCRSLCIILYSSPSWQTSRNLAVHLTTLWNSRISRHCDVAFDTSKRMVGGLKVVRGGKREKGRRKREVRVEWEVRSGDSVGKRGIDWGKRSHGAARQSGVASG